MYDPTAQRAGEEYLIGIFWQLLWKKKKKKSQSVFQFSFSRSQMEVQWDESVSAAEFTDVGDIICQSCMLMYAFTLPPFTLSAFYLHYLQEYPNTFISLWWISSHYNV